MPGINVTQISARDVNITTRGATSTLATSQLALVDGRSIYLDFFGMVMWDLVPTNPHEIKQIEVVRGPASAVWGANAMTGVVNVHHEDPARAGGGWRRQRGDHRLRRFNRDVTGRDQDAGSLFYVNGSHAQAVDDRWSYKLSAGYFTQDALPRPVGTIPNASTRRIRRLPTPARRSRSSMRASITTSRRDRGRADLRAAASPGPKGSFTPASARSTSTAPRG